MFEYSDPSGTDRLETENALAIYRQDIHGMYVASARTPGSAFTLLEAFEELIVGAVPRIDSVSWIAYPRLAQAEDSTIDASRFRLQEEYVEWLVEKGSDGRIKRIIFTTEFPEYYESLAAVGFDALVRGIQDIYPNARPSVEHMFGPSFDPNQSTPAGRARQFRKHFRDNPWNNGESGILCLGQPINTVGALFGLVDACAVPAADLDPSDMCDAVSGAGACVPGRNSDPTVCSATQGLAQDHRVLSLADPVGIRILQLGGIWKIDGQQIDINNEVVNQGAWRITRNGRRAELDLGTDITQGDSPITSGAQVARALFVAADVVSAPESAAPAWSKTGQESSRAIS